MQLKEIPFTAKHAKLHRLLEGQPILLAGQG